MMRLRLAVVVLAAALALTAALAAPALGQLGTFGYANTRQDSSPASAGLSPAAAHNMTIAWRASVGGAITGQPLAVDGVRIHGRAHNLLLVGTEAGQVVALDAAHGRVLWRARVGHQHIAPNCGASPNGVFGITGTMAVDRAAGRVYAVDITGHAWALTLSTGRPVRGWPLRALPAGAFEWSALTLSHGWLYIPDASMCDTGHVFGGITAINVAHPRQIRVWHTTGSTGSWGGGIWGWGGVSVDERTGDIYAATGNAQGTASERVGYSEAVVRLSPRLTVEQFDQPLRQPSGGDLDFGTTPVLIHAAGCPAQLVAINKDGELFLYDRDQLRAGPVQRLQLANPVPNLVPLYGAPAYDPASRTLVLTVPTTPASPALNASLQAYTLTAGCHLTPRWKAWFDPTGAGNAPMIANGVIYVSGGRDGWFRGYRLSDGKEIWEFQLAPAGILAAAAIDAHSVYVGDWAGRVTALRDG